jgi:hypothetical protein
MALGRVPGPDGLDGVLPVVAADDVAVLGARDAAELAAAGCPSLAGEVRLLNGHALAAGDALAAVRDAVTDAVGGTGAWWLHVDLDVLGTHALPAVDYPQPGGIGWERLAEVAATALERPGCAGASVAIYNPDLDGGAAAQRRSGSPASSPGWRTPSRARRGAGDRLVATPLAGFSLVGLARRPCSSRIGAPPCPSTARRPLTRTRSCPPPARSR